MVVFDGSILLRNKKGQDMISLADNSLMVLKDKTGKDLIVIYSDPDATSTCGIWLRNKKGQDTFAMDADNGLLLLKNKERKDTVVINAGGGILLRNQKGQDTFVMDSENSLFLLKNKESKDTVVIHAESGILLRNNKGQDTVFLDANNGDIIFRNADCAEDFEVSADGPVEAGTVMVLNDIGKLEEGKHPYDKRVAGVVSGAGDLKPGLVLGRLPGRADRMPIALMGRVHCKVDANYESIEIGDLLTTSATRGHAMKASDSAKSFGAVIGKALRPLKTGTGMVPILVALQ